MKSRYFEGIGRGANRWPSATGWATGELQGGGGLDLLPGDERIVQGSSVGRCRLNEEILCQDTGGVASDARIPVPNPE